MNPKVSLVSTVINEISSIGQTISDIENQTLLPSEIIITDAGSTDGTLEKLKTWAESSTIPIKILSCIHCNVARGRNMAIENASHALIVSTDFGCRYHKDWLKKLSDPFNNPEVMVAGGTYTVTESEIISLPGRANYILTNGYKIIPNPDFIPSSRSIAYYKSVWKNTGGYPEWLTLAADDLVFGLKLKAKGYKIVFVNEPHVYWRRHFALKGYLQESYRYGLGDGEARVNVRNMMINSIEMMMRWGWYIIFIFLLIFQSSTVIIKLVLIIPMIILIPGFRPYYRALKNWNTLKSKKYNFKALLMALVLIELTRGRYLYGYFKGYMFSSRKLKRAAHELHANWL